MTAMTSQLRQLLAAIVLVTLPIGVGSAQQPTQVIAVATRDEHTQISDIYTIQLNGENRINLTRHPADDIYPAWAPDGERIAFSSDRDGTYDIWLMSADGLNPAKLTDFAHTRVLAQSGHLMATTSCFWATMAKKTLHAGTRL